MPSTIAGSVSSLIEPLMNGGDNKEVVLTKSKSTSNSSLLVRRFDFKLDGLKALKIIIMRKNKRMFFLKFINVG